MPSFDHHLAHLDRALSDHEWQRVRDVIIRLNVSVRSYLPTHKKGATIAYRTLCDQAAEVVKIYRSQELQSRLSDIVGCRVIPTPLHDQNSCSVLIYERPGDHIAWHYDYNFYKGRHFTVLIPIINSGAKLNTCSSAQLVAKIDGGEQLIPTTPNSLTIFEGAKLLHKVTPIAEDERRVILSMTFCEHPANSWLQEAGRRVKDTAFFGLRSLWT